MATEAKLRQLADKGCPVYYFYSTERYLVRQAVNAAVRVLSADSDEDATVLDGVAPEIEGLIMAAGTISFFGTRRVVVLPEVDPGAYGAKDLDELCSTLASLENAVVVLGSVFPLERSKLKAGKSAQKLIAQCKAIGYVEELAKPRPFELKAMMIDRAKAQGTSLPDGAAAALLERCGEDPFLLENEVDKLCALSGYQTVTAAMVADMGTVSLEADVFEMIRMITAKNATGACKKLQTLLRLQQEPIAITAAMIGSYVDLYRVKLGAARKKNYSTVFKDFGYKGSDYRLKRSAETASHYTLGQIEACLQVLLELDQSLKSQPVERADPAGNGAVPAGHGREWTMMQNEMIHTGRVLIVEGKYDAARLAHLTDAMILLTDGFGIYKDKKRQQLFKALAQKNGLILLTDSDAAGFRIRNYITNLVGEKNVVQAYVPAIHGKEKRKEQPGKEGLLGVEGVEDAIVLQALRDALGAEAGAAPARPEGRQITYTDLYEWGLSGKPGSAERKAKLLNALGLPPRLSKKELVEALNRLYTFEQLDEIQASALTE